MFALIFLIHFSKKALFAGPSLKPRVSRSLLITTFLEMPLRVQVPNNHILTQNLYYNYYYPNPKYRNIGYMDP